MATATVTLPYADASPAELREAILPESREAFDTQYRAALDAAATTLRLDGLKDFLEGWRRTAWVQTSLSPERYQAMLAKADYINHTGTLPPGTVTCSEEDMMELIQTRLAELAPATR